MKLTSVSLESQAEAKSESEFVYESRLSGPNQCPSYCQHTGFFSYPLKRYIRMYLTLVTRDYNRLPNASAAVS